MISIANQSIMRLYERKFGNERDKQAFIESVSRLEVRLTAVDVSFRLYQSETNPLILSEIWFYPDKDTMMWVRAIIDKSAPLLTQFNVETRSDTFALCRSFDVSEDD
ncbi:MAG: hypothetical protein ISQ23_06350 [Alphaproteobacteria bacterium]|nr:hypothetical protein [Alphaproteobacteria bacterium]MBL6777116.1 hypothetical protein [Alphaproteobacteria bacterium]